MLPMDPPKQEEVTELGLLSYNYEVSDPKGQIGDSSGSSSPIKANTKIKNEKAIPLSPQGQTELVDRNPHSFQPTSAKNVGTEMRDWCIGIYYWIPIRSVCWLGSMGLVVLPFLDFFFSSPPFVEWWLSWYVFMFGVFGVFIESPTFALTKGMQLSIYFHARFLRRTSGRGFFYLSVSILTLAPISYAFRLSMIAGFVLMFASVLMFVYSRLTAKILHQTFAYMKSGGPINGDAVDDIKDDAFLDEQQMAQRIEGYYRHIDAYRRERIGTHELCLFAEQVLQRKVSNSEIQTLILYLDDSCNGYITPQDWVKQFKRCETVKFL